MPATLQSARNALVAPPGAIAKLTRPDKRESKDCGLAVLCADVSRSMLLHERLGDHAARSVIDRLLGYATAAVRSHGGRVVKFIGDEVIAVLPDANAAARAACDLMLKVDQCEPQGGVVLGMHAGFHSGAFVERDGDITGDTVNIASRLSTYAQGGQILTTSVCAVAISPLMRRSMRRLGALDIRGRCDDVEVEEIVWRDGDADETTIIGALPHLLDEARTRLVLGLGERAWTVGPLTKHLSIGRDPCSDICAESAQASRNHGFIRYANGGFFYNDTSLNGSFVSFASGEENLIRRSEVLLSGQGVICFGQGMDETDVSLGFRIESVAD